MNIEMINNQSANRVVDIDKKQYGNLSTEDSRMKTQERGYSLDITGKVMENAAYGKEELKSAQEVAQTAGMQDTTLNRNYMAVMSNSMSSEDFAELIKDGVDPTRTSYEESVTNLDKIKIKMAEAGVTIEGYNDDLPVDNLPLCIKTSLEHQNLPTTKENIEAMQEVYMVANNLEPLSDDAVKYMLTNDLEPTVENIYKAEHSSLASYKVASSGYRYDGANTYVGGKQLETAWSELEQQAKEIVEEADIPNIEEGLKDAKWLVENQIPLTKDTLEGYEELKDMTLPASPKDIISSMTAAIAEGKEPKEANLTITEDIYTRAAKIVEEFKNMDDGGNIANRRKLEEVRLAMTTEANLILLRKGIQIETLPLEKLVEKLKEAENEFYAPILDDEDKISLYKETREVIEELPYIPLRTVADVVGLRNVSDDKDSQDNSITLREIHDSGVSNRDIYTKAQESYEALMTAPRADMGDSMTKAFANVDDILEDLDFDVNDVNRKAVRCLSYAGMPIDKESIENIREVTNTVERVINLMTPARTLKMIRDGYNPLNDDIYELEERLSNEPIEEVNEKYSQYLWKLEKQGDITPEEKSAYIGLYRLFNLIEKQDGKVIGNVLSSGEALTMQNMLSASRSNRHKNMDVKIDDDFGLLEDLVKNSDSISDQISKGFINLINSPIPKDYVEEKLKDIRRAAKAPSEVVEILNKLDEPVTVENILVASNVLSGGNKAIRRLFNNSNDNNEDRDDDKATDVPVKEVLSDADATELLNDFTDRDMARQAYERYCKKALDVANKNTNNADNYSDVRQWSLIGKRISFAASMSRQDSYEVPVMTENGYASIHLTIKHAEDGQGKVNASFETESFGKVSAEFTIKSAGVDGFIVSDSRFGTDNLKAMEEKIKESFKKEGINTQNLSIIYSRQVPSHDFNIDGDTNKATNRQLYNIARAFIVALEKE